MLEKTFKIIASSNILQLPEAKAFRDCNKLV